MEDLVFAQKVRLLFKLRDLHKISLAHLTMLGPQFFFWSSDYRVRLYAL
jgi:hypothetical protein